MIVPDASVLLEVLLRTPVALRIEERLFDLRETLHVPHLVDLEVAQVLRRYVQRGEMTAERGRQSLELLAQFPMRRHGHEALIPRVWLLRQSLTAYDAAYVALAEGLRATLLTRDARLANAPGHTATIELV